MSKIITFPNGLRLWLKSMKNTRSVSIGVFVGAGSMHETPENNGVAHFIEHMVFKGTTKRTAYQIVDEMEHFGIQINAFTSKNMTAFYTVAIDEYAEKCMDMLSDLYYNATFTDENIHKEKGVVLEEISMSEDDPEDLCMELLCKAHFGNDQLAMPILGNAESVKSFDRAAIKEFMQKYYTSDNTLISVVGNISPENAVELVKKYFEINGEYILPAVIAKGKAKPQKQFLKKTKDIEQANIGISFPSYSLSDKQSSTASLITSMLGGGMSSRLFQKIREELGLVYNIYANDFQYVTDGYINIFFATNPSTAKQALLAIREIILKVIEEGFSQDELEKSKAQFKSALILAAESSAYQMRAGGKYGILTNKEFNLDKKLKDIERVTPEEISKALKYIFNLNDASISYVGKEIDGDLRQLFIKGEKNEAPKTV
jgi:predicted Zn-dependent peptidase